MRHRHVDPHFSPPSASRVPSKPLRPRHEPGSPAWADRHLVSPRLPLGDWRSHLETGYRAGAFADGVL